MILPAMSGCFAVMELSCKMHLSGVERTGPPDGGLARVVRHGRAGAGRARCRQSDGVKRRKSDRFSSDEGPAGVRPRRTLASRFGRRWRDRQDGRSRGRDMHSPLHTRRREAVRERDDKLSTRAPESCGWRAAPAAKPLGVLPAIAGLAGRHPARGRMREGTTQSGRPCKCAQKAVREEVLPVLMENRGTLMRNTKQFVLRPGEKGTRTRTGRTDTGRTAVGRASSFNPEEPRSSRFRSYGPSLREERSRSFRWCPVKISKGLNFKFCA